MDWLIRLAGIIKWMAEMKKGKKRRKGKISLRMRLGFLSTTNRWHHGHEQVARVRTRASKKKNPDAGNKKAKRKEVRNQRVCGRLCAYFGADFSPMALR